MKYYLQKNDIVSAGVGLLKLVGELKPHKSKLPITIYRFFNYVVLTLNFILLLTNLPKATGDMFVELIGSIGFFAHSLLRYSCLVCYEPEICGLLNDMTRFWNVRDTRYSYKLARRLHYLCSKLLTSLFSLCSITITLYCMKPLATKDGLMFPCRMDVDFIGFQIGLLFSQYYGLLITAAIVAGYDIIYIGYSAHVIIQIRMLKYRFQHITRYVDIGAIKSYIRHHQFMLKIFDRMKSIYFWMFFFLYALTLLTGCSQLYIAVVGDTQRSDFLASLISLVAVCAEFGLYTSVVDEVVCQFRDIAFSAYKCSWYERSLDDRKVLLFIMMKGQRQGYFSARGLAAINVDTFGSVFRKVFSFYAILKNVFKK